MTLSEFISSLINKGEVRVAHVLQDFDEEEIRLARIHLQQYYTDDINDMPGQAPPYNEKAALWAAAYLYRTIQFLLLRHLEAAELKHYLPPFDGEQTPAAIYSADLCLRYLPDIFLLAKGISPEDPLVKILVVLAAQWPLSAATIPEVSTEGLSSILEHPSLKSTYIDRIILAKDYEKCQHPLCLPLVVEALGMHIAQFWPQFKIDLTAS
ncbi:hypothetical protein [Chitinophaga pinensis]|uniref:MoxR-vWA-beta-propeller ternary system domain-containing protein n=1 Tax=Chitinophaga pinensis (strain ATCC 43595 / DSM 2588 / LMG 13176 / NBRC 15968 / NCIMB 11800 / UQM 2034) TaxID=485918 RepID=A0A979GYM3_CHIPD|nr:hypothetical protein [Chitinophaga pinensis]ACU63246.1 hypothetical protein Cpin_5827 [Chitinophaga pinensis DSM 2588]